MTRRLKPCCCCSQEQMSCDLLWPCKISLGIWTDFNRLFIENFFGEKNLNEMFFFLQMFLRERCVVRASLAALLWTHPQPEWRWTHTHTHTFFPSCTPACCFHGDRSSAAVSGWSADRHHLQPKHWHHRPQRSVQGDVTLTWMLTCSFLSFMTKNTWMCLNLKYSSLLGVKCSQ